MCDVQRMQEAFAGVPNIILVSKKAGYALCSELGSELYDSLCMSMSMSMIYDRRSIVEESSRILLLFISKQGYERVAAIWLVINYNAIIIVIIH